MSRYKAFISYKHVKSSRFAENLELAIKAYAKPIYRPPMAVFRDEKYLRPGVELPVLIRNALDESEYLIYLASPEAAGSDWVKDELGRWCESEERRRRLVIVLTDGNIGVDAETKRLDWERTDALPATLAGALRLVPYYVDLSWARSAEQQTLLNPDYKKAINAIVAALRHVDPIDLSGQEIIQHRKNIRIRNAFIGAIGALALLLGAAAWFAWDQMHKADRRAREATSRRLAAEADRLAEGRMDTALLLMAQAYRMADNTALRSSWWRLLGAPGVPETYLPVRGSDLRFEPDGRLEVTTDRGVVSFRLDGDEWHRAAPQPREDRGVSATPPVWEWSGGCERESCEDAVWECAADESRFIGPYGDQDSFCVRSRLRIPDWCGGGVLEVPGFNVEARRVGERVEIKTDRGSASYACVGTSGDAAAQASARREPRFVSGSPGFFARTPELERATRSGLDIRRVSYSFDGRWMALLRVDGGVELWRVTGDETPRSRLGMKTLDLPGTVQAAAASTSGAVAVALGPTVSGHNGEIRFWRDYHGVLAGREPDLKIPEGWPAGRGGAGVLVLSAEGDHLAAGTDVALSVWDTVTGQKRGGEAYIGRQVATAAAFSAGGGVLAVLPRPLDGALPSGVWLFGPEGGAERGRLGEGIGDVAFASDASGTLLTAGRRGVQAWSLATGTATQTLVEEAADKLAIAPGRRRLAASLPGGYVLVRSLDDPPDAVRSGRRTAAAKALAFLSLEGVVLRASESGLEAWSWPADSWLTVDAAPYRDVAALPDGLVLGLREDGAAIFDLNPRHWLRLTCDVVRRNLSRDEWRTHFGEGFGYQCTCPAYPPGEDAPLGRCPNAEADLD